MPSHLQKLVGCSARSMVFPSKGMYVKQSLKLVKKWARVHRFPEVELCQKWLEFLEEQWPMHMQAAESRFTFRDVCRVRQHLKHLVCHSRDHAYQQVMVFCPDLFRQAVCAAFEDKSVYEELAGLPQVFNRMISSGYLPCCYGSIHGVSGLALNFHWHLCSSRKSTSITRPGASSATNDR